MESALRQGDFAVPSAPACARRRATLHRMMARLPHVPCARAHAPPLPAIIAHAGGQTDGLTYANAREALDASDAQGVRLMQADLPWTADGRLVCIHDRDGTVERLVGRPARRPSAADFLALRMVGGRHQLDRAALVARLEAHPDARVAPDP